MNSVQSKKLQQTTNSSINLVQQNACRMRWALVQRVLGVVAILCLCSGMAQGRAQECGDNPMKQVLLVAKRAGRSLTHVLTLLRDIDGGAYDTLTQKFRLYAACVGLVDTGYFRKRSGATMPMLSPPERPATRWQRAFGHHIHVRDIEIANSELPFNDAPAPKVSRREPEVLSDIGGGGDGGGAGRRPSSKWLGAQRSAQNWRQIGLWLSNVKGDLTTGVENRLRARVPGNVSKSLVKFYR